MKQKEPFFEPQPVGAQGLRISHTPLVKSTENEACNPLGRNDLEFRTFAAASIYNLEDSQGPLRGRRRPQGGRRTPTQASRAPEGVRNPEHISEIIPRAIADIERQVRDV